MLKPQSSQRMRKVRKVLNYTPQLHLRFLIASFAVSFSILISFLSFVFTISSCGKKAETVRGQRKDITQAVYASGKIYPVNNYKVYSKLPGYIEKIHVKVNETVTIGQPLITIKSEVSEINVNTAKNLLDLASKNVQESSAYLSTFKQEISNAKSRYQLDSTNSVRFSNLFNQNATSKNQLDQAKTQFDISKQSYLKAANNLASVKQKLNVEFENARLQYEAQQANRADYIISSVTKGKIYDIIPKEGELVNAQMTLMEIGDAFNYEVELNVDETDISLLKKGQKILFSIDAYKDRAFEGNVFEVYPRINISNKTSKVLATIKMNENLQVYSGMSVEGNIIITEKKNALVIPREYLINDKAVKIKGQEDLVPVTKGAEDLEFVEITSGITENDELIKP